MQGKKILIGISGSIAAYKIPILLRLCIKEGAVVRVVMTPAARAFVSPLVLSTLSRHRVVIELAEDNDWANHVALGRWADLFLIAPASCNTLAKMSQGICDNLLLAVYLSATCPVWVAPAMDEDMWHHAATRQNLETLMHHGVHVISARHGELASGLTGMGRMAEPEELLSDVQYFFRQGTRLQGKTALVTAGPTFERLDPVRYIGNFSTGKMGVALALALADMGCRVELVSGPGVNEPVHPLIHTTRVESAQDMYEACIGYFPQTQIAIMSAAVADYMPDVQAVEKIKKQEAHLELRLKRTPEILSQLGQLKKADQILVGFALETQDEKKYALQKLKTKNADIIIMNSLRVEGAGFGHDTNAATLFSRTGDEINLPLQPKTSLAKEIVCRIVEYMK